MEVMKVTKVNEPAGWRMRVQGAERLCNSVADNQSAGSFVFVNWVVAPPSNSPL